MSDFAKGLAQGIEKSIGLVKQAVEGLNLRDEYERIYLCYSKTKT